MYGFPWGPILGDKGKLTTHRVIKIDLEASEDDIVEIQQEISVLGTCASPHVTKYYGSFVKGYKLWISQSAWDLVSLVLGTAADSLNSNGIFGWRVRRRLGKFNSVIVIVLYADLNCS